MLSIRTGIDFIKRFDPLNRPTQAVKNWLDDHPTTFKVVLIVNHFFRAAMMAVAMFELPFSMPVNGLICLAGTLFYRLTIQGHCPYKLDVTSLFGATSLLVAKKGLHFAIEGMAHQSLASLAGSILLFLPLTFYACYVVMTSEKKCCCQPDSQPPLR